jgi:hypothetical protein
MSKLRVSVCCGLALASSLCARAADIGYPSVNAARAALETREDAITDVQQGWLIVTEERAKTYMTWTFAPRDHPAHPAVVRREIVARDGQPSLRMHVLCEGPRVACEAFYAAFAALVDACRGDCTTRLP